MIKTEEIGRLLESRGWKMGTAESCTGGRIANRITSAAGSSAYFVGSVVSYCNEVKHNVLGVSSEDLERFGAVSRPVVEQMARGVMCILGCECAVATSGIAGPGGGTAEKPVGTVWVAAACGSRLISRCYKFSYNRLGNIEASTEAALQLLYDLLKG